MGIFRTVTFAAVVLATVTLLSCEDDGRPQVKQLPFVGIRVFDENCTPSGGDTTDFVPRPSGPNYSLVAACPNPAVRGMTLVVFNIPQPDSVWLFVYDRTNSPPVDTLYSRRALAGSHGIVWSNPGATGMFRVEMNTANGFRSHGDVEFVP